MKKNVKFRDELSTTAEAFRRLREEIELKMHLARMDMRDAWAGLRPELIELENSIASALKPATSPAKMAADEARLQAHLAWMNAAERWEKLEPKLSPIVNHLGEAGSAIAAAVRSVEEAGATKREADAKERHERLHAALDRAHEAEAKIRREKVNKELSRARAALESAGADAVGQVRRGLDLLWDRMHSAPAGGPG